MRLRSLLLIVFALALVGAADQASAQCSMCATALTGSEEGRAMSASFNRAILVMLAAPYMVVGAFALTFFRPQLRETLRRARGTVMRTPPVATHRS